MHYSSVVLDAEQHPLNENLSSLINYVSHFARPSIIMSVACYEYASFSQLSKTQLYNYKFNLSLSLSLSISLYLSINLSIYLRFKK